MPTSYALPIFEERDYQVVVWFQVSMMSKRGNKCSQKCIWNEEDADDQIETTSLCQILFVSIWDQSIGSTLAYKVTPHPCSVGTAEVESVNRGKGENHGKDWDYAPIDKAPWSSHKSIQRAHESKVGVNITLSFVRTLVWYPQMLESRSSFRKSPPRKRSLLVGRASLVLEWRWRRCRLEYRSVLTRMIYQYCLRTISDNISQTIPVRLGLDWTSMQHA